jgi:hypothetical protein
MVDSAGRLPCSVIIDNLPTESSGLEALLRNSDSPVISIKCLAHMANLVFDNTVSIGNFVLIMGRLTELQDLLRSPSARKVIGRKCPGSSELDGFT